ncbi:MAG: efflux RND transporter periplasmic adaptor subunit [Deltaproteobacteria bacterium]|nr:MAG: efflux RND transporter periplasmic adaptor subunit [Deltaproteobacteria bacterium]
MTEPSPTLGSRIRRVVVPVAIFAAGIAVFAALKATKPAPKKKEVDDRGPLVEVVTVNRVDRAVQVRANGRVIPARVAAVSPEVSGRIVWQNPHLVPGGRVRKGEPLIRIDKRDYELAVRQFEANVDQAELQLQIERSRKKVAEREWALLGEADAEDATLALREPQLRTAKVAVDAARSGLEKAKLAVERTVVRAPFNALVRSEQAEVGQLAGPQSPIATLVGTDAFWVEVAIPIDNVPRIRVPGVNAGGPDDGAPARIVQQVGERQVTRAGRVVRLLGDLDPTGGMARVLVEIRDPLGIDSTEAEPLPILIGAYVDVFVDAGTIDGAVAVPRVALRDGDHVFVVDRDGRLRVRDITIAWREPEEVLVTAGLDAGDRVIVSRISDPIPGMRVRVAADGEAAADGEPAKVPTKKDAS